MIFQKLREPNPGLETESSFNNKKTLNTRYPIHHYFTILVWVTMGRSSGGILLASCKCGHLKHPHCWICVFEESIKNQKLHVCSYTCIFTFERGSQSIESDWLGWVESACDIQNIKSWGQGKKNRPSRNMSYCRLHPRCSQIWNQLQWPHFPFLQLGQSQKTKYQPKKTEKLHAGDAYLSYISFVAFVETLWRITANNRIALIWLNAG